MTVFWNKQTVVALLASILFVGMSVGCGPKSGGSNDRVVPADTQSANPQNGSGEKPTAEGTQKDENPDDVKVFEKNLTRDEAERERRERLKEFSYDQLEKERGYEPSTINDSTPNSSGERYGEFGAVLFDDPMWYPGLPDYPAGHASSILKPIFTQGESVSKYAFTDGKSDDLMDLAIKKSDETFELIRTKPENYSKDAIVESRILAKRIQDVYLSIDTYDSANISLYVKLADGDTDKPIRLEFHGKLDAQRMASLNQRNIKGDKDLTFQATLSCMDSEGGCQNAIVHLQQINGGKICRTAYLVYRSGDAHITMSSADRLYFEASANSNYKVIANFLGNTAFNSCLVNKQRKDFPNRLIQHLRAYCGQSDQMKLPAAKSIGLRTWAAAYGASAFRLTFKEESQFAGDKDMETFSIQGPLVYAHKKNPIYSQKIDVVGRGFFASKIQSAYLVNNDAGGNLNILLRFAGDKEEELRFSSTSLIRKTTTLNPSQEIEQVSDDPRG